MATPTRTTLARLAALGAALLAWTTPTSAADPPVPTACQPLGEQLETCSAGSVAVVVDRTWRRVPSPRSELHVVAEGLGGVPRLDGALAPLQVGLSVTVRSERTPAKAIAADKAELEGTGWTIVSWEEPALAARGWPQRGLEVELDKGGRVAFYTKVFQRQGSRTVEVSGWVVSSPGLGAASTRDCGVRDLLRAHVRSTAPTPADVDTEAVIAASTRYDRRLPQALENVAGAWPQMERGDSASAARDLEFALSVCEPLTAAHNNLAWAYLHTTPPQVEKALQHAQRAAELTGNKEPSVLDTLALAYERNGAPDKAKEVAATCVAVAPDHAPCRARLGPADAP